jgi:hypothetical protein
MIRKWHLKAIVQKTISFLPKSHNINYWFQKNITKGVFLGDTYFYDRLEHAQQHLEAYQQNCGTIEGIKTLELGTGWYPVIPFSLFLCGAAQIHTVDISNLTNKDKLRDTLNRFIDLIEQDNLEKYIQAKKERIEQFLALKKDFETLRFEEILQRLNIHYIVMDARKLVNVATHSIDLVHSNNTFEHVYPEILKDILREFARVTKKEGLQSHFIDMSDHFAHFDKSITIYNFLKYSCKTWDKIIDNNVQPQNRWRFAQFINLYHHLDIPVSDSIVRKGDLEALKTVKIHSEWKQYSSEELAISHCYIFSKMDDRISLPTDEIRT